SGLRTTALAFPKRLRKRFSGCSTECTLKASTPAPASGWPLSKRPFNGWADRWGWNRNPVEAAGSGVNCRLQHRLKRENRYGVQHNTHAALRICDQAFAASEWEAGKGGKDPH